MMKNIKASRSTNGFTLIEMLMVVFLFGLITALSGALFSAVLKGSSKSEITKEVKQSGDYAMGMMERTIRNAKTAVCAAPDADGKVKSLTITDRDNLSTKFECYFDTVSGIASKSGTLFDTVNKLTASNVTLSQTQGVCSTSSLYFACNTAVTPPQITINFTLYQKGTSIRPEDQANVSFESTVDLRTY